MRTVQLNCLIGRRSTPKLDFVVQSAARANMVGGMEFRCERCFSIERNKVVHSHEKAELAIDAINKLENPPNTLRRNILRSGLHSTKK